MHAVSIPAVGTDSIPMSKGTAFLPSPSLAGLCFNQLCELWLLDSAFPLVTVCLCVCEGVCDSVLNMPLLVVTSIKRGENGFHFHVVLHFAFSLCVSFLQPFSLFWRWRLRTQNWVRTTTMQGILVWNISAFFCFCFFLDRICLSVFIFSLLWSISPLLRKSLDVLSLHFSVCIFVSVFVCSF